MCPGIGSAVSIGALDRPDAAGTCGAPPLTPDREAAASNASVVDSSQVDSGNASGDAGPDSGRGRSG